jgi:molybdopterin/thiamine biosynthesis adenylyltransferase
MPVLKSFLKAATIGDLLPWRAQESIANELGVTVAEVERRALRMGILPARYQRNRRTLSVEQQLMLHESRVAVIGCGGLGGYVVEELARLGVGTLVGVDPDRFEEHNLNRQLLSGVDALGKAKVEAAAERIAAINPAITFVGHQEPLSSANAMTLLHGCRVAVDALDAVSSRLALRDACAQLGIPLVHGAIAGWYGQVTTEFPGDGTLAILYGRATEEKGAETTLGNPSFTPAVVASLQAAEVCKVLLGVGQPLRKRVLTVNLQDMTFETFGA